MKNNEILYIFIVLLLITLSLGCGRASFSIRGVGSDDNYIQQPVAVIVDDGGNVVDAQPVQEDNSCIVTIPKKDDDDGQHDVGEYGSGSSQHGTKGGEIEHTSDESRHDVDEHGSDNSRHDGNGEGVVTADGHNSSDKNPAKEDITNESGKNANGPETPESSNLETDKVDNESSKPANSGADTNRPKSKKGRKSEGQHPELPDNGGGGKNSKMDERRSRETGRIRVYRIEEGSFVQDERDND